jgi:hypothetical protein
MVHADAALFSGLGHYFEGMARILRAELDPSEADGLKEAAPNFQRALSAFESVRRHEDRIISVADPIEYSAYFVRRHEVASENTEALRSGVEAMVRDLAEGYYPAAACGQLNPVLSRMMASFEKDARVEGILHRLEMFAPEQ